MLQRNPFMQNADWPERAERLWGVLGSRKNEVLTDVSDIEEDLHLMKCFYRHVDKFSFHGNKNDCPFHQFYCLLSFQF